MENTLQIVITFMLKTSDLEKLLDRAECFEFIIFPVLNSLGERENRRKKEKLSLFQQTFAEYLVCCQAPDFL